MSTLTLLLIRLAFLAVLWLFVITAVGVVRPDLFGQSPSSRKQKRPRRNAPPPPAPPPRPAEGAPADPGADRRPDPHRQDRCGIAPMTLALRYAIRSDVGLLREGNEDAAYAGPRLLAVADGMGGHAAGEVASAAAITAIARLDDDVAGSDLLDALADAVNDANHTLHNMVGAD